MKHHTRDLVLLLVLLVPAIAWGHAHGDVAGGLLSGMLHPIGGLDHVVAMIAVGLWGAQLAAPAIWLLPVTFPLVMALGGILGVLQLPFPGIELGIAISAIVLGTMVLFAARPPLWVAATIVGAFAIFHGHAHGTELPTAVEPLAYGVGFVVATGLLHVCGIAIGLATRWPLGVRFVRLAGAAIAATGVLFLVRAVG